MIIVVLGEVLLVGQLATDLLLESPYHQFKSLVSPLEFFISGLGSDLGATLLKCDDIEA